MQSQRCLLFVPGSRPERFSKAIATDSDMVCIDLEDAVLLNEKDTAREAVIEFFADLRKDDLAQIEQEKPSSLVGIRINSLLHLDGVKDVIAISESTSKPDFIMLPKVTEAKEIKIISSLLESQGIELIALIESPEGIRNSYEIAKASRDLKAIMLGGADLSVELGCQMDWDGLSFSRGQLVSAAAKAGIAVIDVPFLDIKDQQGLAEETGRVRNLGFTAKSAIHPNQVKTIHKSFMPTVGEIEKAKKIVNAAEKSDKGAIQVDGRLVDRPVILAAQKTLELAKNK